MRAVSKYCNTVSFLSASCHSACFLRNTNLKEMGYDNVSLFLRRKMTLLYEAVFVFSVFTYTKANGFKFSNTKPLNCTT